jgi:hypothetical protein
MDCSSRKGEKVKEAFGILGCVENGAAPLVGQLVEGDG